jgi:phosphatidylserine/phosphatidylglycerophosphate/cardiolipin synthase-like enzyme
MPWQDVHAMSWGPIAYDIARNFIQRWNFLRGEKQLTHLSSQEISAGIELPKEEKGYSDCKIQMLRCVIGAESFIFFSSFLSHRRHSIF